MDRGWDFKASSSPESKSRVWKVPRSSREGARGGKSGLKKALKQNLQLEGTAGRAGVEGDKAAPLVTKSSFTWATPCAH